MARGGAARPPSVARPRRVWFPGGVRIPRIAVALVAAVAALAACKRTPPLPPGTFTMSDLAAATAFDARVARLSLLATQYKAEMTLQDGPRLRAKTEELRPRLDAAAREVHAALDGIRSPDDRGRAGRVAEVATRWPALLAATRDELLGPAQRRSAADALAAADEQLAQALLSYREYRAGWRIADAPEEAPAVVQFLSARHDLEALESRVGARLPTGPSSPAPVALDPLRSELAALVGSARERAAALDPARRAQALAWVDAQERAIAALLDLAAQTAIELREKASLEYQGYKVAVLEAAAEYTRLTAARAR